MQKQLKCASRSVGDTVSYPCLQYSCTVGTKAVWCWVLVPAPFCSGLVQQLSERYHLPLKTSYNMARGFFIQLYAGACEGGGAGHTSLESLPSEFIKLSKQKNNLSFVTADLASPHYCTKCILYNSEYFGRFEVWRCAFMITVKHALWVGQVPPLVSPGLYKIQCNVSPVTIFVRHTTKQKTSKLRITNPCQVCPAM